MADTTFASDIFNPFNVADSNPLNVQNIGAPVQSTQAVDQTGQIIVGPVQQTIDPLTGNVINSPAVPANNTPSLFADIENALGGAANFTITALIIVAAIVIVPRILPERK